MGYKTYMRVDLSAMNHKDDGGDDCPGKCQEGIKVSNARGPSIKKLMGIH